MRKAEYYSAVYLIIKDDDGKILFGRRGKTGFKDGYFQIIPAGHLEGEEEILACAAREAKEEIGIDIKKQDLEIVHISHRIKKGDRIYFDIYINVKKYSGEIKICEEDKCSEIKFFDINNLGDDKFVYYDIECLKKISNGEIFSEIFY